MSISNLKQPLWHCPNLSSPRNVLKVYNSLTRQKDEFIPSQDNHVSWYCCGPTVYDKSHMGHARAYITFDILRRIMENYFGYHIQYVMNITDIDDKIIREARHKFLFEEFKNSVKETTPSTIDFLKNCWKEYVSSKLEKFYPDASTKWNEFLTAVQEKKVQGSAEEAKFDLYVKTASKALEAIESSRENLKDTERILLDCRDVIAPFLDSQKGHLVTDPLIFREFSSFWENEYFRDMDDLNIKRPSVLTRVSEYVPEIIGFVEKIISNGYGYTVDGSVYFDTVKFDKSPQHHYAKLEPWSAGNMKLLQEGEGDLSKDLKGKKNASDFALWKKSKPGEPAWSSPWGLGRPGWHIECSAMAGDVIGETLDIHSGGIDLAFPHHDNEIAQCEGYFNCKQWVNYFLHAGHLHIEGQKMSKSLKNFVTIREALEQYSAAQIRIFFLLHSWESVLDYSGTSMLEAKSYESFIHNFLNTVKALIREDSYTFTGNHNFHEPEKTLTRLFHEKQTSIHNALCDSFNTPLLMNEVKALVSAGHSYYQECLKNKKSPNLDLLKEIAKYITKIFCTLGVFPDLNSEIGGGVGVGTANQEDVILPFVKLLSSFRDRVRQLAHSKADLKEFLILCDSLRDEELVELGVSLEDREDGRALVKLVDKESLMRELKEKKLKSQEKLALKALRAQEAELKRLERLKKGSVAPKEMFKSEEFIKEYSEWDELGIPTKDLQGNPVSKSKRKKFEKDYSNQEKLHLEYLAS